MRKNNNKLAEADDRKPCAASAINGNSVVLTEKISPPASGRSWFISGTLTMYVEMQNDESNRRIP